MSSSETVQKYLIDWNVIYFLEAVVHRYSVKKSVEIEICVLKFGKIHRETFVLEPLL